MTTSHEQFFVITGAPGSGKTTLLHSLEDRYHLVMPASSRGIIRDQISIGGNALPWEDKNAYAELILHSEMRTWREAPRQSRPVLFDGGIPDIISYCELQGLPVPEHLMNAAKRFTYHKQVFIAPYWAEIYKPCNDGLHTHEKAEAIFNTTVRIYEQLGYELRILPKENLDKRVQFVMDTLASV